MDDTISHPEHTIVSSTAVFIPVISVIPIRFSYSSIKVSHFSSSLIRLLMTYSTYTGKKVNLTLFERSMEGHLTFTHVDELDQFRLRAPEIHDHSVEILLF